MATHFSVERLYHMDMRFLQVHQHEEIKTCTHSILMKPKDIYHFKTISERGQLMQSTSWAASLSAFTLKKITKTQCKAKELAAPCVREEKQGLEINVRSRSSSLHHPIKGQKLYSGETTQKAHDSSPTLGLYRRLEDPSLN